MALNFLNQLDVSINRYDDDAQTIQSATISAGEPDACGHRYQIEVSRTREGHYLIQTNFSEVFEQRIRYQDAIGYAMYLASNISVGPRSLTPDREIGWND